MKKIFPYIRPNNPNSANNTNDVLKFFYGVGGNNTADGSSGNYGYNYFIMHYAKLTANYIDAFIIGSEMIGLTSFYTEQTIDGIVYRTYPAVAEFKKLAKQVKDYFKSVGKPNIKVIYSADWSEYHHTDDGWFNMDELWSDDNIDIIGIDNYMPITPDLEQSEITYNKIKEYWEKGEGWDYWV